MSDWWTYRLSDFLMFGPRAYYRLFALNNLHVWPAQVVALCAGVAMAVYLLRPNPWRERMVAVLLAAAWLGVAWGYFHLRYATIHWAADDFALVFAGEALLWLLLCGVWNGLAIVPPRSSAMSRMGIALFLLALAIQPLAGHLVFGRPWDQAEVFGVAPDPTAIATLGVWMAAARPSWLLLPIPLIWCAYSAATLWTLHATDTVIPLTALVIALLTAFWKLRRPA